MKTIDIFLGHVDIVYKKPKIKNYLCADCFDPIEDPLNFDEYGRTLCETCFDNSLREIL